MGSFNSGCGISNLSIDVGDEIGIIMIVPSSTVKYESTIQGRAGKSFYFYSTDLYEPFLPPIYGSYGDYGRIEGIRASPTTGVIETMFDRSVEDVVNSVGAQRSLYSTLGSVLPLYMPEEIKHVLSSYKTPLEEKFLTIGFKTEGSNVFTLGDFALERRSSNQKNLNKWHIVDRRTGAQLGEPIPNLGGDAFEEVAESFAYQTKMFPGFPKKDWERVSMLHEMSSMTFLTEVYESMRVFDSKNRFRQKARKKLEDDFKELFDNLDVPFFMNDASDYLSRTTAFPAQHRSLVAEFRENNEFLEIDTLLSILRRTNHMLIPSFNGEQFGDTLASKKLAQVTNRILGSRLKKEKEDW